MGSWSSHTLKFPPSLPFRECVWVYRQRWPVGRNFNVHCTSRPLSQNVPRRCMLGMRVRAIAPWPKVTFRADWRRWSGRQALLSRRTRADWHCQTLTHWVGQGPLVKSIRASEHYLYSHKELYTGLTVSTSHECASRSAIMKHLKPVSHAVAFLSSLLGGRPA